jgi:hypothetical protein
MHTAGMQTLEADEGRNPVSSCIARAFPHTLQWKSSRSSSVKE